MRYSGIKITLNDSDVEGKTVNFSLKLNAQKHLVQTLVLTNKLMLRRLFFW